MLVNALMLLLLTLSNKLHGAEICIHCMSRDDPTCVELKDERNPFLGFYREMCDQEKFSKLIHTKKLVMDELSPRCATIVWYQEGDDVMTVSRSCVAMLAANDSCKMSEIMQSRDPYIEGALYGIRPFKLVSCRVCDQNYCNGEAVDITLDSLTSDATKLSVVYIGTLLLPLIIQNTIEIIKINLL